MVTHHTIHLDGQLGTSSPERWSVGFAFGNVTGTTPLGDVDLLQWATRAAGFLAASTRRGWWQSISTSSTVTAIRAYTYGPTGGAVGAAAVTVTGQAGTGTGANPFQSARVYTLQTGTPGRSGRGRVYVPDLVTGTAPTTGKSSPVSGVETSLASFLSGLRRLDDAGADILYPGVHSRALDLVIPITAIRVGDVLDTQRRRRDALVETYRTAPVS